MRLNEAKLLTDENIHPEVVRYLEEQGHDVLDVKRDGLVGSSDLELVRRALADGRVIVTHDRDFGRLIFASGESIWGILYLRPGHHDPAFTLSTRVPSGHSIWRLRFLSPLWPSGREAGSRFASVIWNRAVEIGPHRCSVTPTCRKSTDVIWSVATPAALSDST